MKDFLATVARDINCISDEVVGVRMAALKRLDASIFGSARQLTDEQLQDLYPELMKPLLKRFGDKAEKCRELAISMTAKFMAVIADLGFSLPYVMPAVTERLGQQWQYDLDLKVFVRDVDAHDAHRRGRVTPLANRHLTTVVEPSEEVRLLLAKVIGAVLDTAGRNGAMEMVKTYLHHIVLCAVASAVDPFPALKVYGYGLVALLCRQRPEVLKFYAVGLVRMMMLGVDHRHAKVRLAALDAVDAAVACEDKAKCRGAGTEAIVDLIGHRDANVVPVASFYRPDPVINYFAKLGIDKNPAVRRRFVEMLGGWMLNLPDRIDHEARLMPFLITMVGDDVPAVHNAAIEVVDALGIQYEKEHHDEVIERKQYGVDGDKRVDRRRTYPAPFTGRPRLGARLWVRTSSPRFVKVVLKELGAWVSETKRHAARLIVVMMVYLEEHITHDVHLLLRCLYSAVNDPEIRAEGEICARLCGWFADPDAYMPLVLPYIKGDAVVPAAASIESVLSVVALILEEVRPSRMLSHVRSLVQALDSTDYTDSRNPAVKRAYVRCLAALSTLLNGRIGAAVGATFDSTGRLRDIQSDVTRLLRLLLSVERRAEWAEDIDRGLQQLSMEGGDVTQLVSERLPVLLSSLASTYPDRLWSATGSQQSLLEHSLALASPVAAASQAETIMMLAHRVTDRELGERGPPALKRLALLLAAQWQGRKAAAAWRTVGSETCALLASRGWMQAPLLPHWLALVSAVLTDNACTEGRDDGGEGETPGSAVLVDDGAGTRASGTGAGAGAGAGASDASEEQDGSASASLAAESARVEEREGGFLVVVDDLVVVLPELARGLASVAKATSHALRLEAVRVVESVLDRVGVRAGGQVPVLLAILQDRLDDSRAEVRVAAARALPSVLHASGLNDDSVDEPSVTLLKLIQVGLRYQHVDGASAEFKDALTGLVFEAAVVDPAAVATIVKTGAWAHASVDAGATTEVAAASSDMSTPCADLLAHAELLTMLHTAKAARA